MRIVAALGGNALLRRGERPDADTQLRHVHEAGLSLAELVLAGHELVVTHGNGPQVGLLALESAADADLTAPYPLDLLGAETQGLIGSLLVRELRDRLPDREIAALVTHTEVAPDDPAFARPSKFIGRPYTPQQAEQLAAERGWTLARDGDARRRVVPSPAPARILELPFVRTLLAAGDIVVCAGGGGIPLLRDPATNLLRGAEAVVDKDLTAALLAELVEADALLILTDVTHVYRRFGHGDPGPLTRTTPAELRTLDLPQGSMGPKARAAASFVERTGRLAGIGPLDDALGVLLGTTGTLVCPGDPAPGAHERAAEAGARPRTGRSPVEAAPDA
ncbi:carbamate kinase [Streptacidiphilus rugosus]|uniref:carbamate kinase n=1 Tax=Streptacidiphilus rugosus TaxID=405783 RepID=UPI0007C7AF27|nr:carbamate kinase [Streptacidiphilus rugosus]